MIQIIVAVIISVIISFKITSLVYLKLYEQHLDYIEVYMKRTILAEAAVLSILGGKDSKAVLYIYKKSLEELEEEEVSE